MRLIEQKRPGDTGEGVLSIYRILPGIDDEWLNSQIGLLFYMSFAYIYSFIECMCFLASGRRTGRMEKVMHTDAVLCLFQSRCSCLEHAERLFICIANVYVLNMINEIAWVMPNRKDLVSCKSEIIRSTTRTRTMESIGFILWILVLKKYNNCGLVIRCCYLPYTPFYFKKKIFQTWCQTIGWISWNYRFSRQFAWVIQCTCLSKTTRLKEFLTTILFVANMIFY